MIPNCAHALFADIVSPFVFHDDELIRDTTFGLHKQVGCQAGAEAVQVEQVHGIAGGTDDSPSPFAVYARSCLAATHLFKKKCVSI